MSNLDKVDMSLDEIIKLSRKESKQKKAAVGRGGKNAAGRGGNAGHRVRGSKIQKGAAQPSRGQASALRRASGASARRAGLRGRGRGRGMNQSVSDRNSREYSNVFDRMSGQTRRGNLSATRGDGRGALRGRGRRRGGLSQAGDSTGLSLEKKKQVALQALQLAHRTLANIERQTARSNIVNARRGITAQQGELLKSQRQQFSGTTQSLTSPRGSRGRGSRGRQRQLNRSLIGTQVTSFGGAATDARSRGRGRLRLQRSQTSASNITVSIDNPLAIARQPFQQQSKSSRRPWRRRQPISTDSFEPHSSVDDEVAKLKTTESTSYVFQTSTFSAASTNQSLNERFSIMSSSGQSPEADSSGRKVFF